MPLNRRVALVLAAVGALFFVVGLLFIRDADSRARARAPTFVTPTSLGARPIGTTVMLVGRIADTNATPYRDFVAFERSEYTGYRGEHGQEPRPRWRRIARVAPTVVITEASGATIDAVGDDYAFSGALAQFEDETLARASASRPASTRAEGFRRGDDVVVLGIVESARAVRAHTLFRGSRADYARSLAMAVTTSRGLGYVFTPLGLVLCLIAFALFRSGTRTAALAALAFSLTLCASCYRSRLILRGTPVEVVTGAVSGNAVCATRDTRRLHRLRLRWSHDGTHVDLGLDHGAARPRPSGDARGLGWTRHRADRDDDRLVHGIVRRHPQDRLPRRDRVGRRVAGERDDRDVVATCAGHHTTLALHPMRSAWFTETPRWQIVSSAPGVFVLDALPSLPEGVTLDDLGLPSGDVSARAIVSSSPPLERLVGFEMWPRDGYEIVVAERVVRRD